MSYDDFIEKLNSLQDLKYKEFNSKIVCDNTTIGVRTPELKRIAKQVANSNYDEFLKNLKYKYFEEKLVHGLTLGYLKLEFEELKQYINKFLPHIDNWAVCDMTAANLKLFKKNKNKDSCFSEIKKYIGDSNSWINRFGYVLLIDYFVEEKYIESILELCSNYKDDYYVRMAIAWLISACYIKYKGKTLTFLKYNNLDDWTYNKSIQKIIESNRISITDKKILKGMKRK